MWHPKLQRVIRINYYHLLLYGLMATTLRFPNTDSVRIRRRVPLGYLLYSLVLTGILLAVIPVLIPSKIFDGYMKSNLILQRGFMVSLGLRILTILGSYLTVWRHRQEIVNVYMDFCHIWHSHRELVIRLAGQEAVMELQQYLANLLWRNLCINYGVGFCSFVVQYQLLSTINQDTLLLLLARFSHVALVLVAKMGIYLGLLLLNHQFELVQLSLKALSKQQTILKLKDLRSISLLQRKSYDLARRIFRIYDVANATVFLNMFASSVNIFYHAVQYSNESIKSDVWGVLFGNGLIIFNVWSSAILMNMLDRVITSCNDIGQLLRLFTELKLTHEFRMELELFANRLRCQRLVYKVCGCVQLDKSACLSYISSVLCYVIIMMQFDLRERNQIEEHHHNYLNHLQGRH